MTLDDLKSFIVQTRRLEGVNWYLRSQLPIGAKPDCCALLVFDDHGSLIAEIADIEDGADGSLSSEIIARIRDLRQRVGVNANFLRNYKSVDGSLAQMHFEKCRIAWSRAKPSTHLLALGPALLG